MTQARDMALLAVDYPPSLGGIQTLTAEIYGRLAAQLQIVVAPAVGGGGLGADLLAPALPAPPAVRTAHEAGQGWITLRYLREALTILQAQRPQPALLHCNHLFAGYAAWWLRRRRGVPYVVWIHGEELSRSRHGGWNRAALAGASAILTNSAFTAGLVHRALEGGPQPRVIQVPLGAPTAWWREAAEPGARPAPAPERAPVILTVARLCRRDRYKGVDVALRAMAELRRRGRDFRYQIAGDGDDRGWLEALAAAEGVTDRVEFLGRVPEGELRGVYDGCDIFLLCSREEATPRGLGFEGFGIVFLEANARGKPVVGGRSGGIPDAVAEGESGLLADPRSPLAVADALDRLLLDRELRLRLGAQGRARVEREYNWDEAAARVLEVHQEFRRG